MMPKLPTAALKLIVALAIAGLIAVLLATHSCRRAATHAAQAKLEERQTGAAIASGRDAVETLGAAQANEAEVHQVVKEGEDAIATAPAGDSNDAAERAACGMRSYRHTPRCVALLGTAAE